MVRKNFSEYEKWYIEFALESGHNYIQIGKRLNRSKNSIISYAKRRGLKCKPKYENIIKDVMVYFLTHTFEETIQKFNLTRSELKSLMTNGYRKEQYKHLRKDTRRKDAWSVKELCYMLRNLGIIERKEIGKRLNRGSWCVVKERMKTLGFANTKYVNGLPYSYAYELYNKRDFKYIKGCKFNLVPWCELIKYKSGNEIINECVRVMYMFVLWLKRG